MMNDEDEDDDDGDDVMFRFFGGAYSDNAD